MTDDLPPARPPGLPPRRSGCLTALMVVAGLIMLLPGLCSILFGFSSLASSGPEPILMTLVLLGLGVGFLGFWLLWSAASGPRP